VGGFFGGGCCVGVWFGLGGLGWLVGSNVGGRRAARADQRGNPHSGSKARQPESITTRHGEKRDAETATDTCMKGWERTAN